LAPISGEMKQLYYNRLTNNRIKSVALGIFTILLFGLFLLYINTVDKNVVTVYHGLSFSILLLVISFGLGQIHFGQILQITNEKKISTYYKLGGLKFGLKTFDRPKSVTLEQDKSKYYHLTLKMLEGQTLTLEKYSTLSEAQERLAEFEKVID
jgi:hypothetical protein